MNYREMQPFYSCFRDRNNNNNTESNYHQKPTTNETEVFKKSATRKERRRNFIARAIEYTNAKNSRQEFENQPKQVLFLTNQKEEAEHLDIANSCPILPPSSIEAPAVVLESTGNDQGFGPNRITVVMDELLTVGEQQSGVTSACQASAASVEAQAETAANDYDQIVPCVAQLLDDDYVPSDYDPLTDFQLQSWSLCQRPESNQRPDEWDDLLVDFGSTAWTRRSPSQQRPSSEFVAYADKTSQYQFKTRAIYSGGLELGPPTIEQNQSNSNDNVVPVDEESTTPPMLPTCDYSSIAKPKSPTSSKLATLTQGEFVGREVESVAAAEPQPTPPKWIKLAPRKEPRKHHTKKPRHNVNTNHKKRETGKKRTKQAENKAESSLLPTQMERAEIGFAKDKQESNKKRKSPVAVSNATSYSFYSSTSSSDVNDGDISKVAAMMAAAAAAEITNFLDVRENGGHLFVKTETAGGSSWTSLTFLNSIRSHLDKNYKSKLTRMCNTFLKKKQKTRRVGIPID